MHQFTWRHNVCICERVSYSCTAASLPLCIHHHSLLVCTRANVNRGPTKTACVSRTELVALVRTFKKHSALIQNFSRHDHRSLHSSWTVSRGKPTHQARWPHSPFLNISSTATSAHLLYSSLKHYTYITVSSLPSPHSRFDTRYSSLSTQGPRASQITDLSPHLILLEKERLVGHKPIDRGAEAAAHSLAKGSSEAWSATHSPTPLSGT